MTSFNNQINILNNRLVEVDATPDLSKSKPVIIHKQEEIGKLLKQLEIMRENWIALKFNDEIFVVWNELVFHYSNEKSENQQLME